MDLKPNNYLSQPIEQWITESSEVVIQDRWIKLRADTCKTADGHPITPYYVLEYSDWVHLVVVNEKDEVLITKQYRHGAGVISYELPCGAVDDTDKDTLAGAKRELLEETGYTGDFELVGQSYSNPANANNKIFVYKVTNPRLVKSPEDNPQEVIKYGFVNRNELDELIETGKFCQALHIASLYLAFKVF